MTQSMGVRISGLDSLYKLGLHQAHPFEPMKHKDNSIILLHMGVDIIIWNHTFILEVWVLTDTKS